tara:strand:- start:63 stop:275 length:213 start_codon:yes stop_codon:yes gene_type:complete
MKAKVKVKSIVDSREQPKDFWTRNIINQEFDSIKEASIKLNVKREHIQMQLSGKVPHVKGLVFERIKYDI